MYKELISVLCIIAGMCVINIASHKISKHLDKPVLFRITRDLMMIIYIGGVIFYTFIHGRHTGIGSVIWNFSPRFYNALIDHHYSMGTHASLMNLCLFIPLGYLLPQFTEFKFIKNIRWWQVTLIGFLTTLTIEVSQIVLQRGSFELDDLIRNTMGAFVGYWLYRLIRKLFLT